MDLLHLYALELYSTPLDYCGAGLNQFRLLTGQDNTDNLDEAFSARLRSLPKNGYAIAMLDTWDKPTYAVATLPYTS